jgi:hypothetical protein
MGARIGTAHGSGLRAVPARSLKFGNSAGLAHLLAIVEQAEADISATLKPEQREKFQRLIKEKEPLWKPRGAGGG